MKSGEKRGGRGHVLLVNQCCRERGGQTDTDTDTDTDTQTDTDTDTDTHALARACSLSYILV